MSPKTINVVVPGAGPRSKPPRRMGVFIKGVGVVQVDVPFGLQKGDQFSFQIKEGTTFTGASTGTTLISCPDFSQPVRCLFSLLQTYTHKTGGHFSSSHPKR